MFGSTGRRAGATAAAIALAGAGAFASAPLASATPAASPQACLDSVKNVRFNDTNGQFLLGDFAGYKLSGWQTKVPVQMSRTEYAMAYSAGKGKVVVFSSVASNWLSASADHDSAACKGAVMTFGFSKADGTGYRNTFARDVGRFYAQKSLERRWPAGSLVAGLPLAPTDTGEWKVRQVAVRQAGRLVVKPISDVSTQVRRASFLNGSSHHWARPYDQLLVAVDKGRKRITVERGGEGFIAIVKGDLVGITGHLTTTSNKGGLVGLKGQPIVLQARRGGAKGTWQTVLVEQKSTHANGYYLLQIKRAKVSGQELRLHYPSPYQSIAKSWQYLGKVD